MTFSTAQSLAPRYRTQGLHCGIVGWCWQRGQAAAGRDRGGSKSRGDHSGTARGMGWVWLCYLGTEALYVSAQCFAVRSLGWVEIPEEDLAPGKSSIAVNNCIQQLSNSKGEGSVENRGKVRAWDGAARQGPNPGPLLLRLAVPTDGDYAWGRGQGPDPVAESTLCTGHPCSGPSCAAGGSERAAPWRQRQGCLGGLSPCSGLSRLGGPGCPYMWAGCWGRPGRLLG